MTAAGVVEALGVFVPARVVTNDELAQGLDTSDEWVRTRTGIRQRHVAEPGVATADLAVEAGQRALKAAGDDRVDVVLVATTSPDRICPATAPEVAARLGLPGPAAFDIGAACTGFLYALATGAGLIAGGTAERVLVIGAETMTRITDANDRDTAVLFGDGAGAVVLRSGEWDEPGAVGPFDLGSDGAQADMLEVPAGGSRRPACGETVEQRAHYLRMDGREVYRNAVRRMVESSRRVLDKAGWRVEDVDRVVAHQANARICAAVADRLGIPAQRRVSNIAEVANTSAASIPLALADGGIAAGDRVLLTAFGAGFTWGSAVLVWPEIPVV